MSKKICYINGRYLTKAVSGGVKRFSVELVKRLEKNEDYEFVVLCPKDAEIPQNSNIKYKKIGLFKGNLWEQISLSRYKLFHKGYLINLANAMPIYSKNNILVIHDVRLKEELNKGITSKTHKKMDMIFKKAVKSKTIILTDSNFSKNRIIELYNCNPEKIHVLRLGYEHCIIKNQEYDSKFDELLNKDYYLTVNSISEHKNTKFIYELAKLHKDKLFYVIGKKFDEFGDNIPSNLIMLGRLSDYEMSLFYKKAKAFISPSLYEGFGLTPLEALYYGCKSIYLSDIEVFKELFSSIATYFNPLKPNDFKFEEIIIDEENRNKILSNYNWDNCALDLINVLKNN